MKNTEFDFKIIGYKNDETIVIVGSDDPNSIPMILKGVDVPAINRWLKKEGKPEIPKIIDFGDLSADEQKEFLRCMSEGSPIDVKKDIRCVPGGV